MPHILRTPSSGRLLWRRLVSYTISALVLGTMIYVLATDNFGTRDYELRSEQHAKGSTQTQGSQSQAPLDVFKALMNAVW